MEDYSSTECPESCCGCVHENECTIANTDFGIEQGMTKTIEQLTARVRELEEENARLNKQAVEVRHELNLADRLAKSTVQLATSQAYAEQLREALDELVDLMQAIRAEEYKPDSFTCQPALKALALPRDTSALDAYVSEKVKEAMK